MVQERFGCCRTGSEVVAVLSTVPRAVEEWFKSGSRVVQKWSKSGSKVVQEWFRSGSKVVQE
eukprot:454735-Pyramimonas_sp.AAC.1